MARGFKVAFATVIATLMALYTPLISLNAYASTLSEVVYEGFGYRVIYKSPLIPILSDDKTNLVLNVKRNGEPMEFGYTLSGITLDGGRDVARGRGYGRAVADVTSYVDDVVRVLREANSNPGRSGLGLLAFIISKFEENGEEYVGTDIISIPIIPGKARGKSIVVEVEFKPVHKVKVNKTSSGEQASKVEVAQTQPPEAILDYCIGFYIPSPVPYFICYYWMLKTVYISRLLWGVPIIVAYIDSIDGDYVKKVLLTSNIVLKKDSYKSLSLDLSLAFKETSVHIAPGPGYYIETKSSIEELFRMACEFYNLQLTTDTSYCVYMNTYFTIQNFYDAAFLAIGISGYLWLVEYEYIWIDTLGRWGSIDKSIAVYLVPYFRSDGKIDYWYHVDDDPYDGIGSVERVYDLLLSSEFIRFKPLESLEGAAYYVTAYTIMSYSGSSPTFGIAIAVGALARVIAAALGINIPAWAVALLASLAVGVSLSESYSEFFISLGSALITATQIVDFNPAYLEIDSYVLYKAGRKTFKVPFMIVYPLITTW